MWITVNKDQWEYIAKTMRRLGKGYEWHTGDYTSIKLKMEDWKEHFPHYLPKPVVEDTRAILYIRMNNGSVYSVRKTLFVQGLRMHFTDVNENQHRININDIDCISQIP